MKRQESTPIMNRAAVPAISLASEIEMFDERLIDTQMRAFLAGKTDGKELLHALYDGILDEPIPQRMRNLLRR